MRQIVPGLLSGIPCAMQSLLGETILSNFDLVQGLLGGDFGLMLDPIAVEDPLVSNSAFWHGNCLCGFFSARMDSYLIHYYYVFNNKAVAKVSIAQSWTRGEEIDKENRRRWSKVWGRRSPRFWEGTLMARAHSSAVSLIRQLISIIQ